VTIRETLLQTLLAYGKLGILIEDAPDAEIRTAREIYGTDGLPRWWHLYDEIESGSDALQAVTEAVLLGNPAWAKDRPLIVVVDRYLKSKQESRALAWDGEKIEAPAQIAERMHHAMRELLDRPASERLCIAAVTSYFDPFEEAGRAPWQPRHHEPLFRLRRSMSKDLLSFGPAKETGPAFPWNELNVTGACRRRLWNRTIESLAETFEMPDQKCARILFTGAGASFANHRLASGIPATWSILNEVCEHLRDRVDSQPAPRQPGTVKRLEELVSLVKAGHSAAEYNWTLEELFKTRRDDDPRLVRDGAELFRLELQRYDHGFPHHSWLLAQLPWTAILTANFDGFHERAAASAASSVPLREGRRIRRLGELGELSDYLPGADPKAAFDDFLDRAGFFKPYGNLTSILPLALTEQAFWERVVGHVEKALETILKGTQECWLVFLGYRMASALLTSRIDRLLADCPAQAHLVWVDPSCCDLTTHPNRSSFLVQSWEAAAEEKATGMGRHDFHPLPARALDFAYDLWCRHFRDHR
jgi:hypothetical protein